MPPTQLTTDDVAMIGWLARVGYATGPQVARRFNRPPTSVYRRLGWLVDSGLLTYERPYRTAGAYLPTRHGLTLSGVPLGRARVRSITYTHDLAVADDLIALEHAGHHVLTERELRAHTQQLALYGRYDPDRVDYWVRLPGGHGRWHYPDLVVESTDERRWAIEVELSAKAPQRLRAIMRAWALAPFTQYAGVLYHTGPKALRAVRAAVAATGADDFVHVRPISMSAASSLSSSSLAADNTIPPALT